MTLLHRVTALLVGLLLAQLTLVGTPAQCGTHGRLGHADESGRGANAQLAIAGIAMGDTGAAIGTACLGCETPADHVPCSLPWATGGCSSMLSCAAPMTTGEPIPSVSAALSVTHVPGAAALAPPNPTSAPELPPPRA